MNRKSATFNSEKGQAIVLLVLLIVGLVAITALAVDGARLYQGRRQTQNGADNAALAGAQAICSAGNVSSAALTAAAQNGFNNDGTTNTVTVNHPPSSGPSTGDNDYVEVVILSKQTPAFAKLIYKGAFQTTARAVARCEVPPPQPIGGGNGLIVLSPTGDQALKGSGSAVANVTGGVFVNSNRSSALSLTGSAAVNSSAAISIVGNYNTWGPGATSPTPATGVTSITDPLSALPVPVKPAGACNNYSLSGGSDTINPGLYCKITVSGGGHLSMNPGTYYVDTGDFSSSGGSSSITANQAFIYVRLGNVTLSGGGTFNLTAPTSGDYKGMLIFMGRTNSNDITISGGSGSSFTGTVYGVASTINLSGGSGALTINSQIIVDKAVLSGSSSININYDPNQGYLQSGGTPFIELAE